MKVFGAENHNVIWLNAIDEEGTIRSFVAGKVGMHESKNKKIECLMNLVDGAYM